MDGLASVRLRQPLRDKAEQQVIEMGGEAARTAIYLLKLSAQLWGRDRSKEDSVAKRECWQVYYQAEVDATKYFKLVGMIFLYEIALVEMERSGSLAITA